MTRKSIAITGGLMLVALLAGFLLGFSVAPDDPPPELMHDKNAAFVVRLDGAAPPSRGKIEKELDRYRINPLPADYSLVLSESAEDGILGGSIDEPDPVTFGPVSVTFYCDVETDKVQSIQLTGQKEAAK